MDKQTLKKLNQLNKNFYAQTADHFSDSRGYYWQGWTKILPLIKKIKANSKKLKILDVGCGNGRFAKFLSENIEQFEYLGLDLSQKLLDIAQQKNPGNHNQQIKFEKFDLVEEDLTKLKEKFDLIVVFGVLHHMPSTKVREKLFADLKESLNNDGKLIISAWQFADDERFNKKIIKPEVLQIKKDDLEKNDYILDWKRGPTSYRYAHMVDQQEAGRLIEQAKLKLDDSFYADGKSEKLNLYLIISRN